MSILSSYKFHYFQPESLCILSSGVSSSLKDGALLEQPNKEKPAWFFSFGRFIRVAQPVDLDYLMVNDEVLITLI